MRRNLAHQSRRLAISLLVSSLVVISILIQPGRAFADPPPLNLPRGFVQETVASGLTTPTAFALAPDGRIFIAEQAGIVRVVHRGVLQDRPFLDIRYKVNSIVQRGLLGIAVHPRWPAVPYVYLSYVYEPPEASGHNPEGARVSRVVRVSANPSNLNEALPDSEVVLVGTNSTFEHIGSPDRMNKKPYSCLNPDGSYVRDCVPNEGNSHSIDQMVFGPDGALYVASGDGTNYNSANLRAQSVDSLAGKILRINPINGNGYASNPFYDGDPGSNRSKVFALGLRNPWRIAFQPTTGALFVADVGRSKWEEINKATRGANFGWPCYEGPIQNAFDPECDPVVSGAWPVTHAIYAYPHGEGRGAVIGGDFVRGRAFPAAYRNAYFYSDFDSATIDYLTFGRDGSVASHVFTGPAFAAVQLTFGSDGALYVLYYGNGALGRIRYVGATNSRPAAFIEAAVTGADSPLEVQFSGKASVDPDGDALRYAWTFGDGGTSAEATPVHVYEAPGRYTVRLTVTDAQGSSDSATVQIALEEGAPQRVVSENKPQEATPPANTQPTATGSAPIIAASASVEVVPAPKGGARILLQATPTHEGLWTMVQWQDAQGNWNDIEGWSGAIERAYKRWWVGPDLYGHGPFRWVVYDHKGGRVLATSPGFNLPESHDQMVVWRLDN